MQKRKISMFPFLLVLLFLMTSFLLFQFWRLINRAQKHHAAEVELISLGYNILHDNDYLIKTLKIYVLNEDEKYLDEYLNVLNDYESFYGRLDRMKEIGLSESEIDKINKMYEIWAMLETLESDAISAVKNNDIESAIAVIYGNEYLKIDEELDIVIRGFVNEIGLRSRSISEGLDRQILNVMIIFSAAFIVILITLSITFWRNNKLKDMYITEQQTAREQAEQSNKYKSSFLATMSHEIRTPMNAILGIAEIQLQSEKLSKETIDAFYKIYESGNLLLHIINDILDISKVDAGKLELNIVEYDIPSLINDSVQITRLRYESKPINFTLKLDENTPLNLFGDELRFKQILNNVLSNAFKYTNEGEINFSVWSENIPDTEDGVMIICRISDTGQGMNEEQVQMLFDEYSRFNLDANRTTVGTGLGMSITKRLLDLMDGKITVESKPNIGSVFTLYIPQKKSGSSLCGSDLVAKLQNFKFQSTALNKKANLIREYMPYGKVLIVDDVHSNLFVARGMLAPYGLKIETVTSGFETIDKIKAGNVYDIIFMDHMMPKMDGIETVKIIRNMGYSGKIVALTANAIVGQAGMFLKNGFDGYISKPVDSRELNFVLNDLIRDKQPLEVVEAARKEQKLKELDKDISLSEIKKIFVMDAEKAIGELRFLDRKLQNNEALQDDDIQSYLISVHGMKSALGHIGEAELSEAAFKLEKAANEKDFDFILSNTTGFIEKLQSIIAEIKPDSKDLKGIIPNEDFVFLKEKIQIIKLACDSFDKKAVKDALNALRKRIWPHQIRRFIEDIGLFVLHSEFDKAKLMAENTITQAESLAVLT